MIKEIKQIIYNQLIPIIRLIKFIHWKFYLALSPQINLIVGSGRTNYNGWFSTDKVTLDVTEEKDFQKFFKKKKISKILAEHVIEHLTNEELEKMVNNFYKYSTNDVNIRIAVPDGFHIDQSYIDYVKPGGTGEGASDHKNLFNKNTLAELFTQKGFKVYLVEYWDENGEFHQGYRDDENGIISRSFLNDERNDNQKPVYTSLIIDFKKH